MEAQGHAPPALAPGPRRDLLLMAEDDEEEYLLATEAAREALFPGRLERVKDGEELLDFLLYKGVYALTSPRYAPRLILLDLNMPRRNGLQALGVIKSDPCLRRLPVLVFTGSAADEDVRAAYDLGANAFVQKPMKFAAFVELMKAIQGFWFSFVEYPAPPAA